MPPPPAASPALSHGSLLHTLHGHLHALLPRLPTSLSSHIQSLLFLLNQGLNLPTSPPLEKSTTVLRTPHQTLETHIFRSPTTIPTRTILVVHGLAATAHNDPRIISFARALAAASPTNQVVVPHLPPLGDCDLSKAPVQLISDVIAAVAASPVLCPSGRLSIASACISAGLSLVAATHYQHVVHAIVTIGTHASVSTVLRHCIDRKGQDDSVYAVYSVMGSFLRPRTALSDMLVSYVTDDHMRNMGIEADELGRLLSEFPEQAKEYQRLRDDPDHMIEQLLKLYRENETVFEGMSPMACLDDLQCETLTLVHARQDDIVPFSESFAVADALKKRRDMYTTVCVTDMLNHGDQRDPSPSDIPDILRLISTFAGFFRPDQFAAAVKEKST